MVSGYVFVMVVVNNTGRGHLCHPSQTLHVRLTTDHGAVCDAIRRCLLETP